MQLDTASVDQAIQEKSDTKEKMILALRRFIQQRPGLEFGNYGDRVSYQSELRSILRDLHDARRLLDAIQWRYSVTKEQILEASKHSFSGRLSFSWRKDGIEIDYCTGQYWPTEYRKAVCALCASLLWYYWRDSIPENVENAGQYIHNKAKKELGLSIARRWFR